MKKLNYSFLDDSFLEYLFLYQVDDQVNDQVDDQVYYQVDNQVRIQVLNNIEDKLREEMSKK